MDAGPAVLEPEDVAPITVVTSGCCLLRDAAGVVCGLAGTRVRWVAVEQANTLDLPATD